MARNTLVTIGLKDETFTFFKNKSKKEQRSLAQTIRIILEEQVSKLSKTKTLN